MEFAYRLIRDNRTNNLESNINNKAEKSFIQNDINVTKGGKVPMQYMINFKSFSEFINYLFRAY